MGLKGHGCAALKLRKSAVNFFFGLCQGIDLQSCRKSDCGTFLLAAAGRSETEGRSDKMKSFCLCAPLRYAQAFGRVEVKLRAPFRHD